MAPHDDILPTITVIGGGNMGSAILAGLDGLGQRPELRVCDPDPAVQARHAAAGRIVGAAEDLVPGAGLVLLAIKPQLLEQILPELPLGADQVLVSILAGVPTRRLEATASAPLPVVRAMPNTPIAIGAGLVGLCPGSRAEAHHVNLAEALFAPAATVLRLPESQMDALTAVSGSGPAYAFLVAEAMLDAAIDLGFDHQQAAILTGTTLLGSLQYLLAQDGFPAAELRRQVTSPGGTTAAALACFEADGFRETWRRALAAATARAAELAG